MKKVLFLAPSHQYVKTVIVNLVRDMEIRNIHYQARGNDSGNCYFVTREVEVKFIWDDPAQWRLDGYRFDEVYGKKELLETFTHFVPGRFVNTNKKMSLSRYIISQAISDCVDDCATPFPNKTYLPDIKKVHFNYPYTIVLWSDGTKTMVKCQEGDFYDNTVGLAMAISKKALGNAGNYYNTFKKHLPKEEVCDGVPAQE